jgi:WD40 repeat protein
MHLAKENAPLQVYVSALAFSPKHSLIRNLFKGEAPPWLMIKPAMMDKWGACLQTLEGHSDSVNSVAFSHDSARLASASSDRTVKIWDASSGACLQTLSIGKALYRISFDITGLYLHTDIGTIDATLSSSITLPTISEPYNAQYQGLALSSDGVWITYNSKNLMWLPSEYRPSCSAVSGKTIGVGVGLGKVWICEVQPNLS